MESIFNLTQMKTSLKTVGFKQVVHSIGSSVGPCESVFRISYWTFFITGIYYILHTFLLQTQTF